ncbi:MAG: glycosyltransferase [Opitutaceae bacterium]|nr:glycosyltransferase [Opitutaceae bacterium]
MRAAHKILIVTDGALARNPRVVKEATALGEAGYAVTVLGVRNHAPSVPLDATLTCNAPFAHRQIELLAGLAAWLRRARVRLAREWVRRGGRATISTLGPAAALLHTARAHPADLTIVHNEAPHWVGTRLIAAGRRVAADIEDWHSEDLLPADRAGRPLELLRLVERTLLHQAVHTTTTSQALADALHAQYGGHRPHVITNSFPLPPPSASRSTPPAFFWFSQTLGPGRGLEPFLAAWRQTLQPSRVVLLGEPVAGYREGLLNAIPADRRASVSFLPLVPPAELPGVIARHDIGLALEQSDIRNRDLTITNKILQYLGGGLAIVATPTAGQREVLAHAPNAGVFHDFADPAAAACALDQLIADPAALRTRQSVARKLAEAHYSWELEAPRLVALVEQALNARS